MIECVESKMRGQAYPAINDSDFARLPFPVPPLAEQRRIVAKVDELMLLCDQLETSQRNREKRRNRLVTSSLNRITGSVTAPETKKAIHFYLEQLPRLSAQTKHIKHLRQTILNLAIHGHLVAQNSNDKPATDLLKQLQQEKLQLLKVGKIKKATDVTELQSSDNKHTVPTGWTMTTLQSVCTSITDGDHLPPPKTETGIPFLVIGNVRKQVINFNGSRFVSSKYYEALDQIRRPQSGDLLYTLVGSYGIPIIVQDDQPFCVQRHIGILRPSKLIDVAFLARTMESKTIFEQATTCATGTAQKTVPLSGLRKFVIPLPPLAEQLRIVAKIDEFMSICDQLESQLTISEKDSKRLLEAVLNEALN